MNAPHCCLDMQDESAHCACLQVSVLPRCTSVGAALSAQTLGDALAAFFTAAVDSVVAIFTESYISLAAVLGMFTFTFCFAVAGGVGVLRLVSALDAMSPRTWPI